MIVEVLVRVRIGGDREPTLHVEESYLIRLVHRFIRRLLNRNKDSRVEFLEIRELQFEDCKWVLESADNSELAEYGLREAISLEPGVN